MKKLLWLFIFISTPALGVTTTTQINRYMVENSTGTNGCFIFNTGNPGQGASGCSARVYGLNLPPGDTDYIANSGTFQGAGSQFYSDFGHVRSSMTVQGNIDVSSMTLRNVITLGPSLSVGTLNQVLASGGPGAVPAWMSVPVLSANNFWTGVNDFSGGAHVVHSSASFSTLLATGPVNLGSAGVSVQVSSNTILGPTTFYANTPALTNSCGYIVGSLVQSSQTSQIANLTTQSQTYVTTTMKVQLTPLCPTDLMDITFSGAIQNPTGSTTFATIKSSDGVTGTDLDTTGNGFASVGSGTLSLDTAFGVNLSTVTNYSTTRFYEVYYKGNAVATNNWNPAAGTSKLMVKEFAK